MLCRICVSHVPTRQRHCMFSSFSNAPVEGLSRHEERIGHWRATSRGEDRQVKLQSGHQLRKYGKFKEVVEVLHSGSVSTERSSQPAI